MKDIIKRAVSGLVVGAITFTAIAYQDINEWAANTATTKINASVPDVEYTLSSFKVVEKDDYSIVSLTFLTYANGQYGEFEYPYPIYVTGHWYSSYTYSGNLSDVLAVVHSK